MSVQIAHVLPKNWLKKIDVLFYQPFHGNF